MLTSISISMIILKQKTFMTKDLTYQNTKDSDEYTNDSDQIPKYTLEHSKKRFSYTALKAWDEIPMNIKELSTLYQYKKQLKSYFMS